MSVYNGQTYLREAIDSILQQSYSHFEFIIINDGSVDASLSIVQSYNDSRIKIINNEGNKGLIYSLNKGIEQAKGKYIARMDADDISLPNRLQCQLEVFKANSQLVIVSSDFYLLKQSTLTTIKQAFQQDSLKGTLLFAPCFCHPTVMIKNIFKDNNLSYNKDFVHAEDYKLWTDLTHLGGFYNIRIPLLKYRSHTAQVSVTHHQMQLKISNKIRSEFIQKLHFNLPPKELETLHFIGNNEFIISINQLVAIEHCLNTLVNENQRTKAFDKEAFDKVICKFWLDSCGYSNLGLKAYQTFLKSNLSDIQKVTFQAKNKLLLKCIIRRWKR